MFFLREDIFADSLKTGLAERAISAPLWTDPAVKGWPPLFQSYLFDNPYLGPDISILHLPPLATLQLMGVAGLIVTFSPLTAIAVLFGIYCSAAALVGKLIGTISGRSDRVITWVAADLLISYPALFMIDRGNYTSGFTNICIILYLVTAASGRWRWFGMVAMALAINYRPNAALITILEFSMAPNARTALRQLITLAAIAILVGITSLLVAHAIDPNYTISGFLRGYALYHKDYVIGDAGLLWNDSLYGAAKSIWHLSGAAVAYNAPVAIAISGLAVLMIGALLWLSLTKRISLIEASFLAPAMCALFTPVYAQYHILALAGPVLILACDKGGRLARFDTVGFWFSLVVLQALCLLNWLHPDTATLAAVVFGAGIMPLVLRYLARRSAHPAPTECLILTISLLVLSPLGSGLSNGLAIAALLLTTCGLVIAKGMTQPSRSHAIVGL
jgi:hypothetical protein